MKSLGRVWIPVLTVKSLEASGNQQDSCIVSGKSLDSSRIAVKSLGRVWGPAG